MRGIFKTLLLAAACAGALAACGGGSGSSTGQSPSAQAKQVHRIAKAAASPYEEVVEQLYVSYFGRPADSAGLASFESALAAANAPTDIAGLSQAYASNTTVRSLIDAFGTSAESKALYGSGSTTDFVSEVFQNVLNRQPAQSGLAFWVNAVSSGSLSQGDAALAIMAGGLTNTTPQGVLDNQLIENRLAVAAYFTEQVAAQNASNYYKGSNAAALVRAMLSGVTADTDPVAYEASVNSSILGLEKSVQAPIINPAQSGSSVSEGAEYIVSDSNQITSAQVTVVVPAEPAAVGTVYSLMSLGPSQANYGTVGAGVQEPALTWGLSCNPAQQPAVYSTWWIGGLYANPGNTPVCQGGNVMAVASGDTLNISMVLSGTVWTETIVDVTTNATVSFNIDLKGQRQNVLFVGTQSIGAGAVSNIQYSNLSFTMGAPEASACFPVSQSVADTLYGPVVSTDMTQCQVADATLGLLYAPTLTLTLGAPAIVAGQSTNLTWAATNASNCVAGGNWSGTENTSGSIAVAPSAVGSYTYNLSCSGPGGTVSAQATLNVALTLPPTVQVSIASPSVNTGQSTIVSWTSTNASSCTESGAWSGTPATSGNLSVSQTSAGSYTYNMMCTGSGGTATSQATLTVANPVSNSVPIIMDGGPISNLTDINRAYVSVTICAPGTTNCQTIDHIILDTGSTGLRVYANVLNSALLAQLPAIQTASGQTLGECAVFATTTVWGGVRKADVKMGGELASGISIETIGDQPGGYGQIPSDCTDQGATGTLDGEGGNGILGISGFSNDCADCVTYTTGNYFSCTTAGCTDTTVPSANIVSNPVMSFAVDNNGVLVGLLPVGTGGAKNVSGALVFGIGTQPNNQLTTQTIYPENQNNDIVGTYKGQARSNSFIDSGSPGIYFTDSTIATCTQNGWTDAYCPASPTTVSFTIQGADLAHSSVVSFNIQNPLLSGIDAVTYGGTEGSLNDGNWGYDFGLPFYFGRTVYSAFDGANTPSGKGPYIAF